MARPGDPLHRYLTVQQKYDREINATLEKAARDIRKQILGLEKRTGIGAEVRVAQLRMVLDRIKVRQHALWLNQVRPTIVRGREDSAKAAERAAEALDRILFNALPEGRAQSLSASLRATADAGIETDMARVPRDLSKAVYRNRDLTTGRVEQTIRSGIIRGLSAREMATEVYKFISPTTPGGAAYAARRLARTELNNAFHEQQQASADRPWVTKVKWNLSGSHPKPDECNSLAGKTFTPGNVPGKPHPNCLCYLTNETVSEAEFLESYFSGSYDGFLGKLKGPPQ